MIRCSFDVQIIPITTILKNVRFDFVFINFVQIIPITTILKNEDKQHDWRVWVQIIPITTILKNMTLYDLKA